MTDGDYLERLLAELRDRYGCHTVLLYGSRARGDATPESDWDVHALRDGGEPVRDARLFEGGYLDAFIDPVSALSSLTPGHLKLLGARVLVERDGAGTGLLERVRALHAAGPTPLPADEEQLIRSWSRKMVERVRRGDLEAHYRLHWLLFESLENWFKLRGLFYRGPKQSLAELEANHPAAHAVFEAALRPGAPHSAIEAMVDEVLNVAARA